MCPNEPDKAPSSLEIKFYNHSVRASFNIEYHPAVLKYAYSGKSFLNL